MMPQVEAFDGKQAIAQMDVEQLEGIVSRALADSVTVTEWQITLLGGLDSSPFAGGVYKVKGQAVTSANQTRDWCVVVKILRSPEGFTMPDGRCINREMAEDQHNFGYWQREAFVAQSDLFDDLPPGLRVPRFLATIPISDTECWLWQEYLPADDDWTWDDYYAAAYRLGQWQAAHQDLPQYSWLGRDWLAGWVHGPLSGIFGMVEGMNGYHHPLLTAYFAPEELAALQQLWADRQIYLDQLARLPQTLCHLDAHRGNLSWQGDDLALLDWAFVGEAALGEELAAFIGATLLLDYVPLADAENLEQMAFAGYLAGLRVAGWSGDEALIWEAYHCAMPLRYAPMSMASMLRTAVQPDYATEWESQTVKPLADILAHRAGLIRFYLSRQPQGKELFQC
jgi:hypothetical protein